MFFSLLYKGRPNESETVFRAFEDAECCAYDNRESSVSDEGRWRQRNVVVDLETSRKQGD